MSAREVLRMRSLNNTFEPRSFTELDFPLLLGRDQNPQRGLFNSKVVSRNHAEIIIHDSQLYIRDTGSSSGTFLNNRRLSDRGTPSAFFLVNNGDQLQLGEDHDVGGISHRCVQMVLTVITKNNISNGGLDSEITITITKDKERHTTIVGIPESRLTPPEFNSTPPSPMGNEIQLQEVEVDFRVYSRDGTFLSLRSSVNAHASSILKAINKKKNYPIDSPHPLQLYFSNQGIERQLRQEDRPLHLFKRVLEAMGFDDDLWRAQMIEDNSLLIKLIFSEVPANIPPAKFESFHQNGVIDLSNQNYATFPTEILQYASSIYRLDMTGNPGVELPMNFTQNCILLSELSLSKCELQVVPASMFKLSSLTVLDLSNNNLMVVPPYMGLLIYLKKLQLRNNFLKNIPDEFEQLRCLSILDLSNNQLDFLPKPVVQLVTLTVLDISFNHVCYLPTDIGKLKELKKFLAVSNKLAALPYEILELTSLTELDLRHNKLSEIEPIASLTKLERLLLDGNQLMDIALGAPSTTFISIQKNLLTSISFSCPSSTLGILILEYCKLVSISETIADSFPNLQTLNISNNCLVSLPESLIKLRHLSFLQLANNQLTSLPQDIGEMTSLTRLDVRGNSLKKLPVGLWKLPNLLYLNASSNFLESFPAPEKENALASCLKVLSLGDNKLTNVYGTFYKALSQLQELITLNLSYNNLSELTGLFGNLGKLEELHISGNKLKALDEIDKPRNLRVLNVSGNELVSLPGRLAKLKNLSVLDARNNHLRYDTTNWPEEWNWNWNLELKHLDFSANKDFSIYPGKNEITDFSSLTKLDILGLTDVAVKVSLPPHLKRKGGHRRTIPDMGPIKFGMAETMGKADRLNTWELVLPNFRNREEHIFAMFDGHYDSPLANFLQEKFPSILSTELSKEDYPPKAFKRTFLMLNQEAAQNPEFKNSNSSGVVVYLTKTCLYVANVGDSVAILSRDSKAFPLSMNHSLSSLISTSNQTEIDRFRSVGGALTRNCQLEGDINVSRAFGLVKHSPIVIADPFIKEEKFTPYDDIIIIANINIWNYLSYQMAVDIAHTEGDPSRAALKIRDTVVSYGATGNLMVMVISVRDLFGTIPKSVSSSWRQPLVEAHSQKDGPPVDRVVLVFTDIKSSTSLWEKDAQAMHDAVAIHNRLMREYLKTVNGYEVKTEGDAFMVSFWDIVSAVDWCVTVQLLLLKEAWPSVILESPVGKEERGTDGELLYRGISVRMGIHIGTPVCQPDPTTNRMDYFGPVVNRAARVAGVADGGDIFISAEAWDELSPRMGELKDEGVEIHVIDLGDYNLKGLGAPEHLFVIYPRMLKGRDAFRKKNEVKEEKVGLIKYVNLTSSEPVIEKWTCIRVVQDIGRDTTKKGKLSLTPSYICFFSKSKGLLKKEKEVLAVELSDVKEIRKIESTRVGPCIEIIALDGEKIVIGALSNIDETYRKIDFHKRMTYSEDGGSLKSKISSSSLDTKKPFDEFRKNKTT